MIITFLQNRTHPLLYITFAYMIGIAFPVTHYILAILAGIGCILICAWQAHFLSRTFFLMCCGCIAAYLAGCWRMEQQRAHYHACSQRLHHAPFDAQARLVSIDSVDHIFYTKCFTVELTKLRYTDNNQWQPMIGTLQIYTRWQKSDAYLAIGDRIELKNIRIKSNKNASFNHYLIKEGIAATLFLPTITYTLIERPVFDIMRTIITKKYALLDTLKKAMNETTFTLFASIFLGYKQLSKQITDITKNHFMTWGVTHYLARSGLHMIIFIFIWQFILAFLPLPWFFKELILILVGLTYGLLSWSSISFIRAFLTFLLYKWCNLLSKQINVLHLLATVCLIVLLANPIQLFFLDFQLSFGLTFALACFNQIQTDHKHQRYNHKIVASS